MKLRRYFGVLAVALSGCAGLPEGEPPTGDIVENPRIADYDRFSATETLATELAMFLLSEYPGREIAVNADAATCAAAEYALREGAALAGVQRAPTAELILISQAAPWGWSFMLQQSGNTVWQREYKLKE